MSYYPIKCPYCLSELANEHVEFNIRTGIAGRRQEIREDTGAKSSATENSEESWMSP